jgi:methylphosphotriester-DNA--protein-cysteine methyltransferase
MRNITLSADEALIDAARAQAREDHTTLNEQFRLWLAQYARKQRVQRFRELMDELEGQASSGGRKFTRDEMNER